MQSTIKIKHIWVACVCEKETVSHHITVFITSRATWIVIIWFELSIFSLPSMKSWLHYHDEDENTQFKYPRWGETSLKLFTTRERGLGHLTWVTFWNITGIWPKTPPLTIHKNKSLLSFPLGRPQDFKLEISQHTVNQCWTFWLAWRSNQVLHPDSSSELKQIHRTCWGTRLKSELVEHLCSWITEIVKHVCLSLHSKHHLHSTQKKTADESQRPSTWMTGPVASRTDCPLGSLWSLLWCCKITNSFLKASANRGAQKSKQLEGMREGIKTSLWS